MAPRKQSSRGAKDYPPTDRTHKLITKARVQKAKAQRKTTKKGANKTNAIENALQNPEDRLEPGSDIQPPAPKKALIRKRGGGRKKKADKFMDEFLTSDETTDMLKRSDRWIPEITARRRPATKPESVPYQLWMSYCMMDEFMYRQSLTEDEVLSLPLIDDVFTYQQGGPQPSTPPGFYWDEEKHLVRNVEEASAM